MSEVRIAGKMLCGFRGDWASTELWAMAETAVIAERAEGFWLIICKISEEDGGSY